MKYDAVLWDMDGVLVDSEPYYAKAIRAMYARHGVTLTPEQERAFVGSSVYSNAPRILEWYPHVTATVEQLISEHEQALVDGLKMVPCLIDGIESWIHRLKSAGVKQAVASSSTGEMLDYARPAFHFDTLFDEVVCAADVPAAKPAPDIFLEAARRFSVDPPRCLVIEDSCNGVRAARAAGMDVAVFTGAPGMGEQPADGDYSFNRYGAAEFLVLFGGTL